MDNVDLARWQFAVTTLYHFLFVPLTIGLVFMIAIIQTMYVVKKEEVYKRMAKFWGKLFLLNFAVGVVTGILQEFQFGMNWSDYSRYVGDVFGGPLAIEALVSFFMESTFLGIWIFGWDKLSKKVHLASIWLVALGTVISAFWILTANSFMQEPAGIVIRNGHAEMVSFFALISNKQLWLEFPHVLFGAWTTGGLFVAGISAYKLLKKQHVDVFKPSFSIAIVFTLVASILVAVVGHDQAQHLMSSQPMKMAASEALWEDSGNSAPWTVIAGIDSSGQKNQMEVKIPALLSILAYNKTEGQVKGIKTLQAEYEAKYGPGNYIPPVRTTFWSFRVMVLAGSLMILLSLFGAIAIMRDRLNRYRLYLKFMLPAMSLPFIANSAGWIMTEMGRQPWIVFGLQRTEQGVSPTVSAGMVLTTLIGFSLVYGILAFLLVFLFVKEIRKGPDDEEHTLQDDSHAKDEIAVPMTIL
ncbi:cytochrome ubiquinol oxidase subunit I [Paenibacillus baekrokdamisoli]|uniref:Cytochrome ubiquinol oxidase subunit I n=1 Tax=Paenibacillus baekrokdamisoli TaxID=1712516 RepID=A0A3G9JM80_9BACL|nr:cytochrome ubiquinol oxidase subunit I [Paenibacillus baekrokdamisoli]MBB3071888.1 cytochrome d ubiquinol oxidase subunit I [Paenibacillus baekrokdamisoli]BBH24129.1 cytochrome ubiquinol oxidase subunit I [Paenibacillus baekrokdamisoli]